MIGLDHKKLCRYATKAEADEAVLEASTDGGRWEARWSGFGECWIVASLSEQGHLLGYLLST